MSSTPQILSLAQWMHGAPWRLALQHALQRHALVWVTRGQARVTVDGIRRGVGVHNALAIPAGTLFSLELGPQCFGLVCLIPPGGPTLMPDRPQHLRIREVHTQMELTALLDAMQRESNHPRDFSDEALGAHAQLMTVWLRRAMIAHEAPDRPNAAHRLVAAYAAMVARDYQSPMLMADYARDLGVTPTHLTRSCRQCCGLTAAEILTQRSLHAARVMLEDGGDSIRHVAVQLGFRSAAYFSRFILHHTGQTPSALRKSAATKKAA
ncbi:helix-turn-helix transcriptional regulator [Pseudohalocynthiibacter aestuariivivens]|uniref:AraC family transcriptional regulator n=1 Tax=Roseovarius pelagicus TaxID=2980108 RepID=A0ABY6DC45_9RHOB|nr:MULTISPECIES: AraC family transcriptional regulator [Rhodobacterales]QIE44359.1 helix-turn-helix transcriptional regulator [Pseudohalocynthiibacter aestuariivivens]UXX83727.1 AraC family transcriptional regulator [Roseovarius pelagicus]